MREMRMSILEGNLSRFSTQSQNEKELVMTDEENPPTPIDS